MYISLAVYTLHTPDAWTYTSLEGSKPHVLNSPGMHTLHIMDPWLSTPREG